MVSDTLLTVLIEAVGIEKVLFFFGLGIYCINPKKG